MFDLYDFRNNKDINVKFNLKYFLRFVKVSTLSLKKPHKSIICKLKVIQFFPKTYYGPIVRCSRWERLLRLVNRASALNQALIESADCSDYVKAGRKALEGILITVSVHNNVTQHLRQILTSQ